jgi:hypothetical protein
MSWQVKSTAKKMTDVVTISMYFNCMNLARKHGQELKVNGEQIRFEIFIQTRSCFTPGG